MKEQILRLINSKSFEYIYGVFAVKVGTLIIGHSKSNPAFPELFYTDTDETIMELTENDYEFMEYFYDTLEMLSAGTKSPINFELVTIEDSMEDKIDVVGKDSVKLGSIGIIKSDLDKNVVFASADGTYATLTVINDENNGINDMNSISDTIKEYLSKI